MEHTTHFDDCGCKSKALEAERDALRLRVAAAEALLRSVGCVNIGDTTALRALLVKAHLDGQVEGDGEGIYTPSREDAEKYADKRLGASKEGK